MTEKQKNKLMEKVWDIKVNSHVLHLNLKRSFANTGILQAQDIARIDRLCEQADKLKKLSTSGKPVDNLS